MLSQSLLQLWAVMLHPAPDRGVIDLEATLLQQFLNIAQRKRIAKIPPDRTKYESGFGLSPFEDRGSGYHFAILSRHHPATLKLQHIPFAELQTVDRAQRKRKMMGHEELFILLHDHLPPEMIYERELLICRL